MKGSNLIYVPYITYMLLYMNYTWTSQMTANNKSNCQTWIQLNSCYSNHIN